MTQLLEGPVATSAPASQPRRAPARIRSRSRTVVAIAALTGLALLGVWFVCYSLLISPLSAASDQKRMYAQFRELLTGNLLGVTAPVGGVVAPGTPMAVLEIPELGLNGTVVVEGTSGPELSHGPGHLRDTVFPGQPGVSAILGRSLTYGAPFRHLGGLRKGQTFEVTTGQGQLRFRVLDVRRAGDPMPPAPTGAESRLVLVSAEGSGLLGALAPSHLVYVDADLVGKPVGNPGGYLSTVPASDLPWGTSPGVQVPLVFLLQLLLVVGLVLVWAARRWSARHVWLVGAPVVLAILVAATGTAFGLVPNLI